MKLAEFISESIVDIKEVRELLEGWLDENIEAFRGLSVSEVLELIEDVLERFKERREAAGFSEWMPLFKARHQSAGVNFTFIERGGIPESMRYEYELVYIFQELCGNAIKHGRASNLQILVMYLDGGMNVTISDNGKGFAVTSCEESGKGIHSIRTKLERIGGVLEFSDHPDGGCIATIKQRDNLVQNGLEYDKNEYIASELHDVLCPALISFSMMLGVLEKPLDENRAEEWCKLDDAKLIIARVAKEARDLSHEFMGK